jgi:hypothetical protein
MELEENNIERFWQWFVKTEGMIKQCIENEIAEQKENLVDQLNELILDFGLFSWDIGLDDENNWFLLISPNGNSDMFAISKTIISEAPTHLDWRFYSSRPAKKWNRQFTIYDDEMDVQFIDASDWYFLVFTDEEDNLELVIEANNLDHLDSETAEAAAEQFIIHEIGEGFRIEFISSIIVVSELDLEDQSSKIPVSELKEYLNELI